MPPPRIIVHPMNITRPVTLNATFICVGQGYGFVNVSWFRGVRNRSPPGRSIFTTMVIPNNITSILTIPDLRNNDRGHYKCRYINSGGETDSDLAKLTIDSKS